MKATIFVLFVLITTITAHDVYDSYEEDVETLVRMGGNFDYRGPLCPRVREYCQNSVPTVLARIGIPKQYASYFFNKYYGYCKYACENKRNPNMPVGTWERDCYDMWYNTFIFRPKSDLIMNC
jgi:hypothetical protein